MRDPFMLWLPSTSRGRAASLPPRRWLQWPSRPCWPEALLVLEPSAWRVLHYDGF